MKKHLPNSLTILRIILVPFFIWLAFFCQKQNCLLWATIVFIVASITDYYDGLLARRFEVISNFGKIMDPLADKILIISALIALAQPKIDLINILSVSIIIIREFTITFLRYLYTTKKLYISANIWGKLKTVLQITGIITALVFIAMIRKIFPVLSQYYPVIQIYFKIYFWIVAFVTVLSGISYFSPRTRKK